MAQKRIKAYRRDVPSFGSWASRFILLREGAASSDFDVMKVDCDSSDLIDFMKESKTYMRTHQFQSAHQVIVATHHEIAADLSKPKVS